MTALPATLGFHRFPNRRGDGRPRFRGALAAVLLFVLFGGSVRAAETIPPKPSEYFNDYASVVRPETAQKLNHELADFERETSNQVLVAIYPAMQSDAPIADYTVRVAHAWQVGQAEGRKNNGLILFVFVKDHKLYMQVGYGLEGKLPDILCKQIIDTEITPRLHAGDFDGGMTAGVQAMMVAARGEYQGTGLTHAQGQVNSVGAGWFVGCGFAFIIMFFIFIALLSKLGKGSVTVYSSTGRRSHRGWSSSSGSGWSSSSSGWSSSDSSSSSSSSSSSDDSFSSGGGDFGGGGAGGSW